MERGSASLVVQQVGRSVFVEESDGATAQPTATTNYFDDDAAAVAAAEVVARRTQEGWVPLANPARLPTGATRRTTPRKRKARTEKDRKAAILAQLRPGLSAVAATLLEALLDRARIQFEDGAWVCQFPPPDGEEDGERLEIDPSPSESIPEGAPPSLQAFLRVCAGMTLGTPGDTGQLVLHDGESGTLSVMGTDGLNERKCGFSAIEVRCSPIDIDLQSFYLVHPKTGRLCRYDSEGVLEPVAVQDPVEAYLRELHYRLELPGAKHHLSW
jgi:hypothetical protein